MGRQVHLGSLLSTGIGVAGFIRVTLGSLSALRCSWVHSYSLGFTQARLGRPLGCPGSSRFT